MMGWKNALWVCENSLRFGNDVWKIGYFVVQVGRQQVIVRTNRASFVTDKSKYQLSRILIPVMQFHRR